MHPGRAVVLLVLVAVVLEARVALVAGEVSRLVHVVDVVGERVGVVLLVLVRRKVVRRVADRCARRLVRRRLVGQQVQLLLAGALGRYVGASGCVGPIAR